MSDVVLAAVIAAIAPTLAVLLTWRRSHKKLQTIHVLVNSRLDAALTHIQHLEAEIDSWRRMYPQDVAPRQQEGGEP